MSQELKITKNGIDVPVRVNTMTGNFEATVGDERLDAPTWAEIGKLIDKSTKRVAQQVGIPFTRVDASVNYISGAVTVKTSEGVATGLHSGNGNVMARVGGHAVQYSRYERSQGEFYRPLSAEDVEEYRRLFRAAHTANEAFRQWKKRNELDLHELVVEALDAGSKPTE